MSADDQELVCRDDRALLTVAARLMRAKVNPEGGVLFSNRFVGSLPRRMWHGKGGMQRFNTLWRWPGVVEVYAPRVEAPMFGRCLPIAESLPGHPMEPADPAAGDDIVALLANADGVLRWVGSSLQGCDFAASDVEGAPPWHYECVFAYPGVMTVHQGGRSGPVAAVSRPGEPTEPDAQALQRARQNR